MASLAAFAPTTAALKARPTATTRRSAGAVIVRAEAPKDAQQVPALMNMNTRRALLGGAVSAAMTMVLTPGRADAKDAKNGVYWISPKDGATVPQSFTVKMGVVGYEVRTNVAGFSSSSSSFHFFQRRRAARWMHRTRTNTECGTLCVVGLPSYARSKTFTLERTTATTKTRTFRLSYL